MAGIKKVEYTKVNQGRGIGGKRSLSRENAIVQDSADDTMLTTVFFILGSGKLGELRLKGKECGVSLNISVQIFAFAIQSIVTHSNPTQHMLKRFSPTSSFMDQKNSVSFSFHFVFNLPLSIDSSTNSNVSSFLQIKMCSLMLNS